jgi:hypothetical protein
MEGLDGFAVGADVVTGVGELVVPKLVDSEEPNSPPEPIKRTLLRHIL